MGLAPLLHSADVLASAKVVSVVCLIEPMLLTGGFTGLAAGRVLAISLVAGIAVIRMKKLPAMKALTPNQL
jgi:hypothetical protein